MLGFAAGCQRDYDIFTYGYFTYTVGNDFYLQGERQDGRVNIMGLSELGRQQRYLIIPETINGRIVNGIGRVRSVWIGISEITRADFASEQLKKIFFTRVIGNRIEVSEIINLQSVMLLHFDRPIAGGWSDDARFITYQPLKAFEMGRVSHSHLRRPANITYLKNFDTDINYGIHFIDNVDYGSLIEFIPPTPIREGYKFMGWYQESETITRWNFEADRLPDEILGEEDNIIFQETRLYAKWQAI